jgi:hypothetical protein
MSADGSRYSVAHDGLPADEAGAPQVVTVARVEGVAAAVRRADLAAGFTERRGRAAAHGRTGAEVVD